MKQKILYIVNIDKFFVSHREEIALKARSFLQVELAAKLKLKKKYFIKKNIFTYNLFLNRGSYSFFSNFLTMINIFSIILKAKPDLIHFISIKPVLIGGIVAKFFPKIPKIFSITGLGSSFIKDNFFSNTKYYFLILLYKLALKQKRIKVIFQNKNDLNFIKKKTDLKKSSCILIPGSGVDLKKYSPKKINLKNPIVMLPSRMLSHKGVYEFINAVKILKKQRVNARFVLVGDLDEENPSGIKLNIIKSWVNDNLVEYWGHKKNMTKILNLASIIVLPSYREGFPKVLMEAAACGRPSITTNVPGCKDAVVNNYTGILVPLKNSNLLANEIEKLLNNKNKINKMGSNSRNYALKNFDIKRIVDKHIKLYREILKK